MPPNSQNYGIYLKLPDLFELPDLPKVLSYHLTCHFHHIITRNVLIDHYNLLILDGIVMITCKGTAKVKTVDPLHREVLWF